MRRVHRELGGALPHQPRLAVGHRQSAVARIARLAGARTQLGRRFVYVGGGDRDRYLAWCEIDAAFERRVLTGAVINFEHIDPRQFLEDAGSVVLERVRGAIERHGSVKVNTAFNGEFIVGDKRTVMGINSKNCELYPASNVREWYVSRVIEPTLASLEEHQEHDSGWALSRILNLTVNVNKLNSTHAGCYIEMPKKIKDKHALVNVSSNDNACFAWSVVAALYPAENHVYRASSYPHYSTVLNFADIEFPVTLKDVKKFERSNNMSVNVYGIEDGDILPLRLTDDKREKHVNLLYVQDGDTEHFVWIKHLSRLVSTQINKYGRKKYFCDRCLHYFNTSQKLEIHSEDCGKLNKCAIRLPSEEKKWLEFHNYGMKERAPFVVYADLECVLRKTEDAATSTSSYAYQQHEVFSIGYYVRCSYDDTLSAYRFRRDNGCVSWFARQLEDLAHRAKTIISANQPMDFTRDDWQKFNSATHCHICERPFAPGDERAHDHCHLTGRYRGPAHKGCNVNYKDSLYIPVVFHNLSGYDAHFVMKEIATKFKGQVDLLPLTKEKSEFSNLSDKDFNLLTRKGVFPYEYVDCVEKLNDTRLPPRESFQSSLTDDTVSESDYAHAANVWKRFAVRTLGEYSDLYLKTDVLLLTDVFENFRESCVASYGLDPAHYYTLPGFTWDAMLKHTRVKFELLTDIDMVIFIERGGLSQCSGRYAKANNKYMQSYDLSETSSYLMYYDVNNLYGWAMCQPLPYADFRWVKDAANFDANAIAPDSPTGYIFEVDLEYPQHLHDAHADLPFCPTRDKPPGKRENKLLATLYYKQRYVIHYRNLQQCIHHGLRVTKIHRVLRFAQSAWLRDYIELNTQFRTRAKNDFEKNLYKLMNNAVFGKTMVNMRDRVDVKLVTTWDGRYGAEALIAKPNFHSAWTERERRRRQRV
ncbi:PREDICTED: uncharacterized protein LOC108781186 [Cyphomyrmex costatus]|uniref:uncharacterized protein LOC108781186 n=1 Tax=Cyphomyrmex costatus TaxID=456900 RepID=UPI0008523D21|nr:PREDICTED: uncharacterized protein LOC108781186 [Cyphomyrmex costatus]